MSLETLAAQQIDKLATQRERNRELMTQHMPQCMRLIDQLQAAGMFGKVCLFSINEDQVNA